MTITERTVRMLGIVISESDFQFLCGGFPIGLVC